LITRTLAPYLTRFIVFSMILALVVVYGLEPAGKARDNNAPGGLDAAPLIISNLGGEVRTAYTAEDFEDGEAAATTAMRIGAPPARVIDPPTAQALHDSALLLEAFTRNRDLRTLVLWVTSAARFLREWRALDQYVSFIYGLKPDARLQLVRRNIGKIEA
jgi:hypothetical protein